jgi:hypothetical protein
MSRQDPLSPPSLRVYLMVYRAVVSGDRKDLRLVVPFLFLLKRKLINEIKGKDLSTPDDGKYAV